MYAVIKTGGKQYKVQQGDVIFVEKLGLEPESSVQFDVLLLDTDGDVKVGAPIVDGASVEGKVLADVKGKKIIVFKMKSKKNYRRKQGHRQPYSKVEITAIKG